MGVAEQTFLEKMKKRWGIDSNLAIIAILVVFAINGSFAAWVADPLTDWIGLNRNSTTGIIYWPVRILLVFPIYQITLPLVGWCFGQFNFFWSFEKKMFNRMIGRSTKDSRKNN